jgi:DNA topoisomerase-1
VKFDGHTALYVEGKDEKDDENKPLPVIKQGDVLTCRDLESNQHFTQPPARYTEATLIKAMEENGIGRPSTYAPTVSTVLNREYVERDGKSLKPTNLGEVITQLMKEQFPEIVDLDFTAQMEQKFLEFYYRIPLAVTTVCSLTSYKVEDYTDSYNIMYGFGGFRIMDYNFSDSEWEAYVASQPNGELNYK